MKALFIGGSGFISTAVSRLAETEVPNRSMACFAATATPGWPLRPR